MTSLFIWFATFGILVAIVGGVAAWVSKKSRGIRNATAFVMAGGASYCASFVVDMWAQAALGDIPPGNVVMPSITWLIFAFVLGVGRLPQAPLRMLSGHHSCSTHSWRWPSVAFMSKTSLSGWSSSYWQLS